MRLANFLCGDLAAVFFRAFFDEGLTADFLALSRAAADSNSFIPSARVAGLAGLAIVDANLETGAALTGFDLTVGADLAAAGAGAAGGTLAGSSTAGYCAGGGASAAS